LALRAYANERKLKKIGRGGWAMVDSNGPGRRRGVASFFVSWLGEHHAFRLAEATRVWSSHTLMACVFILGIWLVEKFTYVLSYHCCSGGSRYSIFFMRPTLEFWWFFSCMVATRPCAHIWEKAGEIRRTHAG
jgi:hypothetical protein